MTEYGNGRAWATCTRRGCHWQGPIRATGQQADDDDREHRRTVHRSAH